MKRDYFRIINTEEKAYWFGFICADGCIDKYQKQLIIDLHIKDYSHLESFIKTIDSKCEIKIHGDKNQYAKIRIYCKEMCMDLVEKGCTPKKSLTLKYPFNYISTGFEKDFIRGYFDGDGCLSLSSTYQKRPDRNSEKRYLREHWLFSLRGTKEFLIGVKNFLPVETSIKQLDINKNHCYIKCGGNKKIKDIMDSIYLDPNIYLTRKYDLYLQLVNYKTPKCL